jgi:hypothetical protein
LHKAENFIEEGEKLEEIKESSSHKSVLSEEDF